VRKRLEAQGAAPVFRAGEKRFGRLKTKSDREKVLVEDLPTPVTIWCGDETFHDWHLEIFEKPSDHAPQVGDPTPIICEITPRTERIIYRDGVRIQSLAGFFRLQDASYKATGHAAQKVRLTISCGTTNTTPAQT
jgi:hypothetical protein